MSHQHSENQTDTIYLQNQLATARKEIRNLRQQLITLNQVHRKECDQIQRQLANWQCLECRNRQAGGDHASTSTSNAIQHDFRYNYIGRISTSFPEKRGTPRQPGICSETTGKIVLNNTVFTNPNHALEGLEEFSHIWVLFHFHKTNSTHVRAKVTPPRLNGLRIGVFATRSPHRPCPIGLSIVKIEKIQDNVVYFSGVDMIDQTPVLDIKPYIPQYDYPGMASVYYPEESCFEVGDHAADVSVHSTDEDEEMQLINSNLAGGDVATSSGIGAVVNALDNLNVRVMDGQENDRRDHIVGEAATLESSCRLEEPHHARPSSSHSRIGEREAPDGEEEDESSRNVQGAASLPIPAVTPEAQIRVPAWIDEAPVPVLEVVFKAKALRQLQELDQEGEEKKKTITNVLREDPRSIYLRERWGSHCYVFRIAELYVSCKFNDSNHTVTVYQVFQNEVTGDSD